MFPYEPRGQKRVSGAVELELQMVMNWPTWVLGTKLWSFTHPQPRSHDSSPIEAAAYAAAADFYVVYVCIMWLM